MVVTALCCVKFYLFNALKTIFTLVSGYIPTVSVSLFKGFVKVSSPSQHVLTDQPRTRVGILGTAPEVERLLEGD